MNVYDLKIWRNRLDELSTCLPGVNSTSSFFKANSIILTACVHDRCWFSEIVCGQPFCIPRVCLNACLTRAARAACIALARTACRCTAVGRSLRSRGHAICLFSISPPRFGWVSRTQCADAAQQPLCCLSRPAPFAAGRVIDCGGGDRQTMRKNFPRGVGLFGRRRTYRWRR